MPVLANIRPSGKYLMQDFFEAGGLRGLMARLDLHDVPTVSGASLRSHLGGRGGLRRRRHPAALEPAVLGSGPRDPPRLPGARRCGHQALRGLCVAAPAHGPRGRLRGLRRHERAHRRPGPRRRRRLGPRPPQRRPARRPGHAGVGHAPDPEEAARAGRPRHGPDQRRPHVRHGLRHLCSARRARVVRRRAFGAGSDRRRDRSGRPGRVASTCSYRKPISPPAVLPGRPENAHATRGYAQLFAQHVTQANEGCDFDFLHGAGGVAEPAIH